MTDTLATLRQDVARRGRMRRLRERSATWALAVLGLLWLATLTFGGLWALRLVVTPNG